MHGMREATAFEVAIAAAVGDVADFLPTPWRVEVVGRAHTVKAANGRVVAQGVPTCALAELIANLPRELG